MVNWCNRIDLSDEVANKLSSGKLKSLVTFVFINVKTDKEVEKEMPLDAAICLAETRREDRRYRNYHFYIY